MSRRIVEHVIGPDAERADYLAVLASYKASHGDYRHMMKQALLRQLGKRGVVAPGGEPAQAAAPALAAQLDSFCTECHDHDHEVDLTRPTLDRDVLFRALKAVSTGRMPRAFPPLGATEREQLITSLAAAWPDPEQRPQLLANFVASRQTLPTLPPHAAAVDSRSRRRLGPRRRRSQVRSDSVLRAEPLEPRGDA